MNTNLLYNQAKKTPATFPLLAAKGALIKFLQAPLTCFPKATILLAMALGVCVIGEELHAEQSQTLLIPSQKMRVKTRVRLGKGWENFRVLHPNGEGFVIPIKVKVDKGYGNIYTGTGGISFGVSADGTVNSIHGYYDTSTTYMDVNWYSDDTFLLGSSIYPGYYQIDVAGDLTGPAGRCGKSSVEGQGAKLVYQGSGYFPQRTYSNGWTITVDLEECSSCSQGTCEPGGVSAKLGSIDLSVGLGKSATGTSKASIRALYPNSGLTNPGFLNLDLNSDAELVSISDSPRQVWLPSGLVDIQVIDSFSYELRFYSPSSVGSKDANGIYLLTGQALKTVRISNPDASATVFNRLAISEIIDSQTRTSEYSYDVGAKSWTLTQPDGLGSEVISTIETLSATGNPVSRVATILQKDGAGTLAAKIRRSTQAFGWGWETTQEVLDPDGSALTTSYEYYTDSAQTGAYGHLKQKTDAYGHWERFEYDTAGFEVKRATQYLDSSSTSADSENRVVTTTYSATAPHKTIVETLQGQEVARRYEVYEFEGASNELCVEKNIVCISPGAAWNAADNLVTITKTYNPLGGGPFRGEVASIRRPDGTMSISSYSQDATHRVVITSDGGADGGGTSITKGTRTEVHTDLGGNQLFRSTTDIASGLLVDQGTTISQDSFGRPARVNYSDGTFELFQYDCCGLESFTDRNGLTTNYTHDALKRTVMESRAGLTTFTSYDGAGRVESLTRMGSDSSSVVLETNTFDLAGRKTSSRDALNNVTTYSESVDGSGGPVRTTTLPDGVSSRVETRYKDGRTRSVTGNAAHPIQYEYGVASGGQQYIKEIKIGDGGSQNEWTKVSTDMAGRPVTKEYADSATEQTYYNNLGQAVRAVDADGVARLFAYDTTGEMEQEAIDLNNNGSIDSSDQVSQTHRSVATAHGNTVFRTEVSEGDTGGYVSTSTIDQTPNGHSRWVTRFGLETSVESSYDGSGGNVQTITMPDGSKVIETFAFGRLLSRQNQMSGGSVIASITNTYDGQGRLHIQTDGRTGTVTTYVHDDGGRITSVDVGGMTTGYSFNALGYETGSTLPGNRAITRNYLPTGEVTSVGGAAEYPVSYTYDAQGRRKTMTTSSGTTTWGYDGARGWLTSKTDADAKAVSYTYTPGGRLASRTWARGITTNYSHDTAGRLTGTTYSDATPAVSSVLDPQGHPTSISDAAGTHALAYNTDGQLSSETISGQTLWNGISIINSYDSLLRRSGFAAARSSATLSAVGTTYDGASRLASVVSGNQSAVYSYLANSSLVGDIAFLQGGATVVTKNSAYDALSRLTSISSSSATSGMSSFAYGYNAAGQRSQATMESADHWDYGYNSRGEVTGGSKKLSSGSDIAGYQFGYAFDNIGNRITATRNGRASTYTPNSVNEYDNRTVPGYANVLGKANAATTVNVNGQQAARQGDAYFSELAAANSGGPVYLATTVNGTLADQTATRQGKLFIPQTPEAFTYDADGNLTSDGRWTYTWDAENRLIAQETTTAAAAAGTPKQKLTFTYDYMSRRIGKKVENWNGTSYAPHHTLLYVYDGWNLAAEVLAETGQKIRSYTWGSDLSGGQSAGGVGGLLFIEQRPENKVFSVGYDGNGNVCRLHDMANSGALAATYEYGPFGELITESGPYSHVNPIRWSTKYQDSESGLVYYGYRYYNPVVGRWINRDPIGDDFFLKTYISTQNASEMDELLQEAIAPVYLFAHNNPLSIIDKLGLQVTINVRIRRDGDTHSSVAIVGRSKCHRNMYFRQYASGGDGSFDLDGPGQMQYGDGKPPFQFKAPFYVNMGDRPGLNGLVSDSPLFWQSRSFGGRFVTFLYDEDNSKAIGYVKWGYSFNKGSYSNYGNGNFTFKE